MAKEREEERERRRNGEGEWENGCSPQPRNQRSAEFLYPDRGRSRSRFPAAICPRSCESTRSIANVSIRCDRFNFKKCRYDKNFPEFLRVFWAQHRIRLKFLCPKIDYPPVLISDQLGFCVWTFDVLFRIPYSKHVLNTGLDLD